MLCHFINVLPSELCAKLLKTKYKISYMNASMTFTLFSAFAMIVITLIYIYLVTR